MEKQKQYRPTRGGELKVLLDAERTGKPFLVHRSGEGELLVTELEADALTIGRDEGNGVSIPWDERVSRTHAELTRKGSAWFISDSGLSSNGTVLDGESVQGRSRLVDGAEIVIGSTEIQFRDPEDEDTLDRTNPVALPSPAPTLTDAQVQVLEVLADGAGLDPGHPPGPKEIATVLGVSVDVIKGHLRTLYSKFGLKEIEPEFRRIALARRAVALGVVRMTGNRDSIDPQRDG